MSEEVKIYIRNSKKYGKVLTLPSSVKGQELYRLAAESQGLNADEVRLILGGKSLESGQGEIALKEKAIVHLINLKEVNLDQIQVSIRPLYSRSAPIIVQTNSQVTIQEFIDDKLFKAYGYKSDKLILVHIGRQLNLAKTFMEELIENHSELICANIDEIKQRKGELSKPVQSGQPISVPIKDLQVPEQPKDIYPQPNFAINVPVQVNATNNLELIFDSKIRHSSSLPNCGFEPEEIIPEEELTAKESEGVKDEEEGQEQKVEAVEQQETFAGTAENVVEEQGQAEVVVENQQAKNEERDERDETI